jgi:hypothetical protein
MIGDLKRKRSNDLKSKREVDKRDQELIDNYNRTATTNNLAIMQDLDNRFGDYKQDVSVGNMYQRKKKQKKSKAKRCGCK